MNDDDLRDGFGREVTDALRARSRVEAPDAGATVEHRVRRVRTRRRVFAATLAAVIIVTGGAVLASRVHGTAHIRVEGGPASTVATSTTVPAGFEPLTTGVADWTWVSADHGWALVRQKCGATVCMSLRVTTNGGRTWSAVRVSELLDTDAQPDPAATCAAQLCVSGVRFANPQVGWLFGPAFLQTTDGGRSWARGPGPDVVDVEASEGVALRLTTADAARCGGGCTYHVERQQLGAGSWQPVSTPLFAGPSLIILRTDAYVVSVPNLAGAGQTELRRSTDAGKTWTAMPDPCTAASNDHITTSASAAPDGVFVVLCSDRARPSSPFVRISTDGGTTFGPRRSVPIDDFGVVRAASAETLMVGAGTNRAGAVLVSSDGGVTWRTTLRPPGPGGESVTLGWEDPQTARASFGTDGMWTTRDAGLSWTRNSVGPAPAR